MGRDEPGQEEELNAIADLPKLKLAELNNVDNLFVRWESEIRRHEAVSREYFIGKFRRRQIVYKSLPGKIQKPVDIEVGKNQHQTYAEFVDFVKINLKVQQIQKYARAKTSVGQFGGRRARGTRLQP